jgi:MoxR-like ATPase
VLRHRVILSPEVEIDGLGVDAVLGNLLDKVDAPRS